MAHRTQKDRVLAALEDAGTAGVSWLTFAADPPDGGTPIAHLAGVVRQLRDDGHQVQTRSTRSASGRRYFVFVLAGETEQDSREVAA